MSDLIVIGAGGHAKVVIATIRASGDKVVSVFDDEESQWGADLLGVPIEGPIERLASMPGRSGVIAIGDNEARRRMSALPLEWACVIHPAAVVHESVHIGAGTVVFAGAVVQPDAKIGSHAILNTSCTVDHDCVIGDYAQIAPGAHLGGNVKLAEGAFVGIGASVRHGVSIGKWTVVGGGAMLAKDLPNGVTAMGVPAAVVPSRLDTGAVESS